MVRNYRISVLIANHFGAMARITEIFSARGYNLDSVCSGVSEKKDCHRMTLLCQVNEDKIEYLVKLIQQQIDVRDVKLLSSEGVGLILMKLVMEKNNRKAILALVNHYGGQLVKGEKSGFSFYCNGNKEELDKVIEAFQKFNIIEMARTGEAAIQL